MVWVERGSRLFTDLTNPPRFLSQSRSDTVIVAHIKPTHLYYKSLTILYGILPESFNVPIVSDR